MTADNTCSGEQMLLPGIDAIMAFLERGSYPDFARFEHDAGGLILVFQTGGILR